MWLKGVKEQQKQIDRLKQILFPKNKPSKKAIDLFGNIQFDNNDTTAKTFKKISHLSINNYQNDQQEQQKKSIQCDNIEGEKVIKKQINLLKNQINTMLEKWNGSQEEQENGQIIKTERHYLEKINQINANLEKYNAYLYGIKQATEEMIDILPVQKPNLFSIHAHPYKIYYLGLLLTNYFNQKIQQIQTTKLQFAFSRIQRYSKSQQIQRKQQEKLKKLNTAKFLYIRKNLLDKAFKKWRVNSQIINLKQNSVNKYDENRRFWKINIQQLNPLKNSTFLIKNILYKQKIVKYLEDELNKIAYNESKHHETIDQSIEILLLNSEKNQLFTFVDKQIFRNVDDIISHSRMSKILDTLRNYDNQVRSFKKYSFKIKNSLTKMCIDCEKILRIPCYQNNQIYTLQVDESVNSQIYLKTIRTNRSELPKSSLCFYNNEVFYDKQFCRQNNIDLTKYESKNGDSIFYPIVKNQNLIGLVRHYIYNDYSLNKKESSINLSNFELPYSSIQYVANILYSTFQLSYSYERMIKDQEIFDQNYTFKIIKMLSQIKDLNIEQNINQFQFESLINECFFEKISDIFQNNGTQNQQDLNSDYFELQIYQNMNDNRSIDKIFEKSNKIIQKQAQQNNQIIQKIINNKIIEFRDSKQIQSDVFNIGLQQINIFKIKDKFYVFRINSNSQNNISIQIPPTDLLIDMLLKYEQILYYIKQKRNNKKKLNQIKEIQRINKNQIDIKKKLQQVYVNSLKDQIIKGLNRQSLTININRMIEKCIKIILNNKQVKQSKTLSVIYILSLTRFNYHNERSSLLPKIDIEVSFEFSLNEQNCAKNCFYTLISDNQINRQKSLSEEQLISITSITLNDENVLQINDNQNIGLNLWSYMKEILNNYYSYLITRQYQRQALIDESNINDIKFQEQQIEIFKSQLSQRILCGSKQQHYQILYEFIQSIIYQQYKNNYYSIENIEFNKQFVQQIISNSSSEVQFKYQYVIPVQIKSIIESIFGILSQCNQNQINIIANIIKKYFHVNHNDTSIEESQLSSLYHRSLLSYHSSNINNVNNNHLQHQNILKVTFNNNINAINTDLYSSISKDINIISTKVTLLLKVILEEFGQINKYQNNLSRVSSTTLFAQKLITIFMRKNDKFNLKLSFENIKISAQKKQLSLNKLLLIGNLFKKIKNQTKLKTTHKWKSYIMDIEYQRQIQFYQQKLCPENIKTYRNNLQNFVHKISFLIGINKILYQSFSKICKFARYSRLSSFSDYRLKIFNDSLQKLNEVIKKDNKEKLRQSMSKFKQLNFENIKVQYLNQQKCKLFCLKMSTLKSFNRSIKILLEQVFYIFKQRFSSTIQKNIQEEKNTDKRQQNIRCISLYEKIIKSQSLSSIILNLSSEFLNYDIWIKHSKKDPNYFLLLKNKIFEEEEQLQSSRMTQKSDISPELVQIKKSKQQIFTSLTNNEQNKIYQTTSNTIFIIYNQNNLTNEISFQQKQKINRVSKSLKNFIHNFKHQLKTKINFLDSLVDSLRIRKLHKSFKSIRIFFNNSLSLQQYQMNDKIYELNVEIENTTQKMKIQNKQIQDIRGQYKKLQKKEAEYQNKIGKYVENIEILNKMLEYYRQSYPTSFYDHNRSKSKGKRISSASNYKNHIPLEPQQKNILLLSFIRWRQHNTQMKMAQNRAIYSYKYVQILIKQLNRIYKKIKSNDLINGFDSILIHSLNMKRIQDQQRLQRQKYAEQQILMQLQKQIVIQEQIKKRKLDQEKIILQRRRKYEEQLVSNRQSSHIQYTQNDDSIDDDLMTYRQQSKRNSLADQLEQSFTELNHRLMTFQKNNFTEESNPNSSNLLPPIQSFQELQDYQPSNYIKTQADNLKMTQGQKIKFELQRMKMKRPSLNKQNLHITQEQYEKMNKNSNYKLGGKTLRFLKRMGKLDVSPSHKN